MTNTTEKMEDRLIFARHFDGSTDRESTQARQEAARRQAEPIAEWRNPNQMQRIEKSLEAKQDLTRNFIESLKRKSVQKP